MYILGFFVFVTHMLLLVKCLSGRWCCFLAFSFFSLQFQFTARMSQLWQDPLLAVLGFIDLLVFMNDFAVPVPLDLNFVLCCAGLRTQEEVSNGGRCWRPSLDPPPQYQGAHGRLTLCSPQ
jgi:hypothetical protein